MKWAVWTSMDLESEVWCGIGKYFTIEKLPLCTISVMCQLPSYKILLWLFFFPLVKMSSLFSFFFFFKFYFIFKLYITVLESCAFYFSPHCLLPTLICGGFHCDSGYVCVLWVGRRRAKHARGQRWLVDAWRWQNWRTNGCRHVIWVCL